VKIYFATIQLTDWENFPAMAVSVNGDAVFEAVDIVRASAKRFFPRGNSQVTLQFSVRREFATLRECQVYLLMHFSMLPKSGLCQIICGGPGEDDPQNVFLYNAVLSASPQGNFNGVEAIVQYTIQAGAATTDVPPDFLIGGEAMILRAKQAIDSGAESVPVVFAEAFPVGTVPIVNATVAKPGSGGANIIATVRDDLVTVDGFTAELSGPTPAEGYFLNWTAFGT
jgi:hypothetical protein